jgi:hypothetical protein
MRLQTTIQTAETAQVGELLPGHKIGILEISPRRARYGLRMVSLSIEYSSPPTGGLGGRGLTVKGSHALVEDA